MKANKCQELAGLLQQKNWTLCSCESCTGGLFAAEMTEVPGVSSFFKGGVVTYWTQIKTDVVHVSRETVEKYGVVSEQTAREMAEKCAELMQCDCSVAFTGNAGPGVMENKPAGMICTAIHVPGKTWVMTDHLQQGRNENRRRIVELTIQRFADLIANGE